MAAVVEFDPSVVRIQPLDESFRLVAPMSRQNLGEANKQDIPTPRHRS